MARETDGKRLDRAGLTRNALGHTSDETFSIRNAGHRGSMRSQGVQPFAHPRQRGQLAIPENLTRRSKDKLKAGAGGQCRSRRLTARHCGVLVPSFSNLLGWSHLVRNRVPRIRSTSVNKLLLLLLLLIIIPLGIAPGYSPGLSGAVLVGGGTSPLPEGWPAPAPRDSELGLPL